MPPSTGVGRGSVFAKGTPEAMEARARLEAGKVAARLRREDEARAALGEAATPEKIEEFVAAQKQAAKAQKFAAKLQGMAKAQQRDATQFQAQAQQTLAPSPQQPQFAYDPPTMPAGAQPAQSLHSHPIFGASVRPGTAVQVDLERLPSQAAEHNGPGITSGFLDTWDFDTFSKEAVRVRHGGGKYQSIAKDTLGRALAKGEFSIAGRARPMEDAPAPQGPFRGFGQVEPQSFGQAPYDPQQWAQEERLRRIEDAVVSLTQPKPQDAAPIEDKFERWKAEQKILEEAAEKKHERRMAELRLQMESEQRKAQTEQAEKSAAIVAAQNAQNDLMKQIVLSSSTQANQLMTALMSQKGGQAEMFAPVMAAVGTMLTASNEQSKGLFTLIKDIARGDSEPKHWTESLLGFAEKRMDKMGDSVLQAILLKMVEKVGPAQQGAQPLQIPQGGAFQLPDGRVVPPEICAEFLAKYKAKNGAEPSIEVCVAAFAQIMDHLERQQVEARGKQVQQQQAAGLLVNKDQADEAVRAAAQQAATAATAAGKPPAEVQAAAQQAAQQKIREINQQVMAARASVQAQQQQQAAPQPQPPATPPPQPALPPQAAHPQQQIPAAVVAMAQQAQASALAEQQRMASAAAVPGPGAPPGGPSATPQSQAPPQTATMLVEAAVQAPDAVMVPWMSRSFPQDVIDAFTGVLRGGTRMDPLDFLEWGVKSGRLSSDAKMAIGRIYEESGDEEGLTSIMAKIYALLSGRGLSVPAEIISVFKDQPGGDEWLETFLWGCSFNTIAEARSEMAAERT